MQLAPAGQPLRSKILTLICTEKRHFERILVIERDREREEVETEMREVEVEILCSVIL